MKDETLQTYNGQDLNPRARGMWQPYNHITSKAMEKPILIPVNPSILVLLHIQIDAHSHKKDGIQ